MQTLQKVVTKTPGLIKNLENMQKTEGDINAEGFKAALRESNMTEQDLENAFNIVANNDGLLKFTENIANKLSGSPVQLQEMVEMAKQQQ